MEHQGTFLDLHQIDLYGWEPEKSSQTVAAIIRGIRQGDDFPAVYVCQMDKNVYRLTTVDGGHNRAIGHNLTNAQLKVIIKRPGDCFNYQGYEHIVRNSDDISLIHIKDIKLVDNPEDYKIRRKNDASWR